MATDIAECAIFVALMVAATYISIPFYPVPLTFQTVVCVLSGIMLGWKKGGIAMLVYALAGLIGLPVFSGGGGGFAYVLKPTFGYIIGFVAASVVAGLVRGNREKIPFIRYLVAAIAAFLVNYVFGILYFIPVWINVYDGMETLGAYLVSWNLLYMPKDLVLCVLAAVLARQVVPVVRGGKSKLKGERDKEAANTRDRPQPKNHSK